jgi:hypothetical protein
MRIHTGSSKRPRIHRRNSRFTHSNTLNDGAIGTGHIDISDTNENENCENSENSEIDMDDYPFHIIELNVDSDDE